MRTAKRIAADVLTVAVTVGLLALGIGLIAGGTRTALGAIATAWGVWSILVWFVARRGSERLVVATVLVRPFAMGTLLLALAAAIIAGKRSLDWVVILPLGVGWIGLGAWLLRIHRRLRRHPPGGNAGI